MSWVKRRGQTTPTPPGAAQQQNLVQMYNPNQHSNPDTNYQQDTTWYNQMQPPTKPSYNYQPQSQPQQQQNYWQPYSQQNPNNYSQPTSQYPPLPNNQQPLQVQNQSYYQNASYQSNNSGQVTNPNYADTQNALYTQQSETADTWGWGWGDEDNSNLKSQSNSNVNLNKQSIAESFANDESWNWSVEESNSTSSLIHPKNAPQGATRNYPTEELFPKMGKSSLEENKVEFKRDKIEHLTPQWSIESQMSQESSDDVLHTSESDKILSRSSTISHSPISTTEPAMEPQDTLDPKAYYRQNSEIIEATNTQQENVEVLLKSQSGKVYPPQKASGSASKQSNIIPTPPLTKSNPTPPPPAKNLTPPLALNPNTDDFKNPYKRTTSLSHKPPSKVKSNNQLENIYYQNVAFAPTFTQSVNLESLPDNSEHPDILPHLIHKMNPNKAQQPDNNEVAPINDRNQYLETGQLSDESTNNLQMDNIDTLPPPGLRRMVLGQIEQNESAIQNISDEPPPGLSRMVLGQTESNSCLPIGDITQDIDVGFHRMIPGESSPPDVVSLQYQGNERLDADYISESELMTQTHSATPQQRSATIGADTPPAISLNSLSSQAPRAEPLIDHRMSQKPRETILDGENSSDPTQTSDVRRESIEGQTQDRDITNLVTSIRDLAVGENVTDKTIANTNQDTLRRSSRESESDSDQEIRRNDRKNKDKDDLRDKHRRDRYPGENYRDRKYEKRRPRDRRYDDDTEEYYSDRERDRRRQERDKRDDYEKKYASLKREKESRDKRRRDNRRDYYYDRYDDYEDPSKSRPSSRSDSIHDSYRERMHEREHRRHRDHQRRNRDPYSSYMQGYYDPYNQYYQQYQQYQYYENLRRTNPQAYAEWYRKYYQQSGQQSSGFGAEDRASVHSGRSSANDELTKDRYTRQSYYSQSSLPHLGGYYRDSHSITGHYGLEESSYARPFDHTDSSLLYEDQTISSQRLTPAKFTTAHVKVSISSGKFVKILPNYPLDGQTASVEIHNLQNFFNDDEFFELNEFPGPLIKGTTHKKTIIEYCENKIRNVPCNDQIIDVESYVLMWELLILLLRQNGMVVGTDIAELLMKNHKSAFGMRPSSVASVNSDIGVDDNPSDASNIPVSEISTSSNSLLKNEVVTNKFRDFLIYGSVKEALEWAIKHGLWGHALFLASKLDKRTYANVMMRFANGLAMNDPLQTLYQLLSGKLPASVTCVADDKWGDWRPHLAMILSNASQHPELERKSITTLGDTLLNRGSLYAAQFCYLMAQVGFNRYGNDDAKLVLLGSNHNKSFTQFATNEAIHMTEIYEYACKLHETQFVIPEFQSYKYLLATRLADRGLLEKSLAYLEQISGYITQNPTLVQSDFVEKVFELADKLKYYDPIGDADEGDLDRSKPEMSWLNDLKIIQNDLKMGLITHSNQNQVETNDFDEQQQIYEQTQDVWNYQQNVQSHWQPEQVEQVHNDYQMPLLHTDQLQNSQNIQLQGQENQWNTQFMQQPPQWNEPKEQQHQNQFVQDNEQLNPQQTSNDYWNNAQAELDEVDKSPTPEDAAVPSISMPNQSKNRNAFDNAEEDVKSANKINSEKQVVSKKEKAPTTGWFGGIWNKFALRPKNQMKLPDDKNPTIVWDAEKKRWINLEEESNEGSNEIKPPPKMSEMFHNPIPQNQLEINQMNLTQKNLVMAQSNIIPPIQMQHDTTDNSALPPKPTSQTNMFKLQRQRNLKKSYVDIFNPGGKKPVSNYEFKGPTEATPEMNLFVPPNLADPNAPIDFLTPATYETNPPQMSRWSSASSLSREVQFYMRKSHGALH